MSYKISNYEHKNRVMSARYISVNSSPANVQCPLLFFTTQCCTELKIEKWGNKRKTREIFISVEKLVYTLIWWVRKNTTSKISANSDFNWIWSMDRLYRYRYWCITSSQISIWLGRIVNHTSIMFLEAKNKCVKEFHKIVNDDHAMLLLMIMQCCCYKA